MGYFDRVNRGGAARRFAGAFALLGALVLTPVLAGCGTQGTPGVESSSGTPTVVGPSASPEPALTAASPTEPAPSPPSISALPSTSGTPDSVASADPEQPTVALPGEVTVVSAGPGGGSGESLAAWEGVADATGYRVYRAADPGGPFQRSASYDVATGSTTIHFGGSYEYIQIWMPADGSFQYVEAIDGSRVYFRIAAFNSAGEGPLSATVCGEPVSVSPSC